MHADSGLAPSGLVSLNKGDEVEFTIEQRDGRGIVRFVPTRGGASTAPLQLLQSRCADTCCDRRRSILPSCKQQAAARAAAAAAGSAGARVVVRRGPGRLELGNGDATLVLRCRWRRDESCLVTGAGSSSGSVRQAQSSVLGCGCGGLVPVCS